MRTVNHSYTTASGKWVCPPPPIHLRHLPVLLSKIGHEKFAELAKRRIAPVGSRWHVRCGMVAPEGWTQQDAQSWRDKHGYKIDDMPHRMRSERSDEPEPQEGGLSDAERLDALRKEMAQSGDLEPVSDALASEVRRPAPQEEEMA